MSDLEYATAEDLNRLVANLGVKEDLALQLLKGHLLIEEIIRKLFTLKLPFPDALEGNGGTSFDCHQVICLVEAMNPKGKNIEWAWVAAKKLNSIRNSLAHQLQPKGLQDKTDDFIVYVTKNSPHMSKIQRKSGIPKHSQIFMAITALLTVLSSLKKVSNHEKA